MTARARSQRRRPTVSELVAEQRLDRIRPSRDQGTALLDAAQRHAESARKLARSDPLGSIALAYDAVRKAVAGHMAANGLRLANAPGAHRAVVSYAEDRLEDVLSQEQLDAIERLRRARNQAEYEAVEIPSREVAWLVAHAAAIVPALIEAVGS